MTPRSSLVAALLTWLATFPPATTAAALVCMSMPQEARAQVPVAQGPVQGQPARRDSTTPQGRRRAIDIRATAPAPEVVTIRPREIPRFPRALLIPEGIQPPAAGDQLPTTVVIFPGSLPVQRPAPPAPPRRSNTPTPPPE